MIGLFPGPRRYDLWLLETTARMLETASRTSDVRKILTLWCEETAAASRTGCVAIFLSEGDRWLRLLPETQTDEVPVVAPADLSRARVQRQAWIVAPVRSQDPRCVIAPFSVREGWSGALLLWSRMSGHDWRNCAQPTATVNSNRHPGAAIAQARWRRQGTFRL